MMTNTTTTETMDAEDYSFYLAYGMTQEQEELQSFIDYLETLY
jgi:hypothetical protein